MASDLSSDGRETPFQAGGPVRRGKLYVHRRADEDLPRALLDGELCYVLAPRQIGKSSLKVRAMERLAEHGVRSADVDLSVFGGPEESDEAWYLSLLDEIVHKLELDVDVDAFWDTFSSRAAVYRWSRFLRQVLIEKIEGPVVLFLDEIDSMLARSHASDDFFAALRAAFSERVNDPAYARLSFCLLGVAAPLELMADPQRTPFNVGRSISLRDFTAEEAQDFLPALATIDPRPEDLLEAILDWTDGHPYLTQLLCGDLAWRGATGATPKERVRHAVEQRFLKPGLPLDINLSDSKDRLLLAGDHTPALLRLYRRIRSGARVVFDERDAEHQELLLTGMVAPRRQEDHGVLRPRNRVFAETFDLSWVEENEGRRPFTDALAAWLRHGRHDDFVLRGEALEKLRGWAGQCGDLTREEHEFLRRGLELEGEQRDRALHQTRLRGTVIALLALVSLVAGVYAFYQKHRIEDTLISTNLRVSANLIEFGRTDQALAYLAEAVEIAPDHLAARSLLVNELRYRRWALPTRVLMHPNQVMLARFDPDASRVLTSSDTTCRLWDVSTGQRVGKALQHDLPVKSAEFSPFGRYIVTASNNGEARLWNVEHGTPIGEPLKHDDPEPRLSSQEPVSFFWFFSRRHEDHRNHLIGFEFSPSGDQLLTICQDQTVHVWYTKTGKLVGPPLSHDETVESARFSRDGRRILTKCTNQTLHIWNPETGERQPVELAPDGAKTEWNPNGREALKILDEHSAQVYNIESKAEIGGPLIHDAKLSEATFSPDGDRVVTTCLDRTARVWDTRTGQPVGEALRHSKKILATAFSSDSRLVMTRSADDAVRIWETATGRQATEPIWHQAELSDASFSRKGRWIVTVSRDQSAQLWSLPGPGPDSLELRHGADVVRAELVDRGDRVVTVSAAGAIRVWDTRTGAPVSEIAGGGRFFLQADASADGRFLATVDDTGVVDLWDLRHPGSSVPIDGLQIRSVSFSSDGRRLLTASSDQTARLWDPQSGQQVGAALRHEAKVAGAVFDPRGSRVVTWAEDHAAHLWDVATGEPIGEPMRHAKRISQAIVSADGRLVATVSMDWTARIWESRSGKPLAEPLRHDEGVMCAAFDPKGRRLATGSEDGTVRVWSTRSGRPVGEVMRHAGIVQSVAFSPDGRRLVTASDDHTARLWDAATGRPISEPMHHADRVSSAVLSLDGRRVLTASADDSARIWDQPTGLPATDIEENRALIDLAEAVGGWTLNEFSTPVPIGIAERVDRLARLGRQVAEVSSVDHGRLSDTWLFIRWFLEDREARSVSPLSEPATGEREPVH